MSLETANTISGLVKTNPTPADPVNQGDDHLRLLKSTLKSQFPGANGLGFNIPITPTEAELNFVEGASSNIQDQIDALVIAGGTDALNAPLDTILIFGNGYAPAGWTALPFTDDYMIRIIDPGDYDPGNAFGGIDSPINYSGGHLHTTTSVVVQSGTGQTVVNDVPMQINGWDWHPRYFDTIAGQKE